MSVRTITEKKKEVTEAAQKPEVQEDLYPSTSTMALPTGETAEATAEGPLYYDVPMVKRPTWGWEIASYFFLGGLSAGAYLIGRVAERFGGKRYEKVAKAGTAVAAASFVPCTPLLIKDLGDASRFHHMLRVIKPESPMNVGTWALTGYGGTLFLSSLREWLRRSGDEDRGKLLSVGDFAGIPLAVMLAAYTGVLLSNTSTPIWSRNPWLGPLFSASAFYNGTEAIDLVLAKSGESGDDQVVQKLKTIGRFAEAGALGGYLASAGSQAKPMTSGRYAPLLWLGAVGAGLVLPAVIDRKVAKSSSKRSNRLKIAGAAIGLLGSFAMRWAVVHAGHQSADDPRAARQMSKPEESV